MPGFDGTGPGGMGPMTGGGRGFCATGVNAGYGIGRGGYPRGGGRGRGRGWFLGRGRGCYGWANPYFGDPYADPYYGDPYAPNITPQQEANMLREEAKGLQAEINAINERLSALEKSDPEAKK